MPKHLLSIPHHLQQHDADCLAACAAMALDALGLDIEYSRLLELLQIRAYGAPAGNIRILSRLDLAVTYSITDMDGLKSFIRSGHPVILFVRTLDLPYWEYNTNHALLAVGYDERSIYVNDPAMPDAPISVPQEELELAWLEQDYRYAVIESTTK